MSEHKHKPRIKERFRNIFTPSSHFFGRTRAFWKAENKFEWVGCVPESGFYDFLGSLSDEEQMQLAKILTYFEIHMGPLRLLLENSEDEIPEGLAWSHFATIIMFGMLEVAVKIIEKNAKFDSRLYDTGKELYSFLDKYLENETKESIKRRYKKDQYASNPAPSESFQEVVQHLWAEIRCGFAHSVGIHSVGLEFGGLRLAGEKDGVPVITNWSNVPMSEWLVVTWKAILTSYGFNGRLALTDTSQL